MVAGSGAIACPNCAAEIGAGARFCPSCGAALTASAGEERKLATILFADVTGSTDLGERLDPERLRALLLEYFAAMSAVIEGWGGTVEKYIGDAILAVFGVPVAREDDPVRALRAASEMLTVLASLNVDFEQRHGVGLAVRIGVNTGEVLAPVGARGGGQFLVSGDPVNVAARLEQAADPGSVLVGERTCSAARNAFQFSEPIDLTVKGKSAPVVARRLERAISTESEMGVRFQAPMIGRERELQTMLGLLDEAVENRQPRLVVVSGPSGIGKSRLLREFIGQGTDRHRGLVVLRGRCLAAGRGITFWALGEILRAASGISLDEPVDSAIGKLRVTVSNSLARLGARQSDVDDTLYALATSANLNIPGNPLERLDPEQVAEAITRAWPRFLSGIAQAAPAAVVVEDLHWADERMIAMLELLAARSSGGVILMATARPEFLESHPSFASSEDLTVVPLRPLTESQTEQLVTELLGTTDPHQVLLKEVRQKADGNPFFLEEILQRLIDERAIVRDDGRWRVTERAQSVQLPDTVHALLAARIDGLPQEEKAILQQAAVVGRIFWPGSLGAVGRTPATGDLLRSLERRGLVSARPTSTIEGETEYIFRHVLIRDVAYGSVPKTRRAHAHAETARWMESLAADRFDEFGELLAYHYGTAVSGEDSDLAWSNDPDERESLRMRAVETLISSGAAACRRLSVEKALELHNQAALLARGASEQALVDEALGDDHEVQFHMDEAVAAYFSAIDSIRAVGNSERDLGRLVAKIAAATERWGAFKGPIPTDRVRELAEEALRLAINDADRVLILMSRVRRARAGRVALDATSKGALPGLIESANEAAAIAERLGDPALLHRAYDGLSMLYWHAKDLIRYREVIELDAQLLDRLPSRRQQVELVMTLAVSRAENGRLRDGLEAAERAFELGSAVSAHERMHVSCVLLQLCALLGEWDRALEVHSWHVRAAAEEEAVTCPLVRGGPAIGATILAWRGETETALSVCPPDLASTSRDTLLDRSVIARYAAVVGHGDLAETLADQLVADPGRVELPDGMTEFLDALLLLGRLEDVATFLTHSRRLVEADAILGPTSDHAEAVLSAAEGDRSHAAELLRRAVAGFEQLTVPFEAARSRELLASLESGAGRELLLREALATYERLKARPFAERVRAALGKTVAA